VERPVNHQSESTWSASKRAAGDAAVTGAESRGKKERVVSRPVSRVKTGSPIHALRTKGKRDQVVRANTGKEEAPPLRTWEVRDWKYPTVAPATANRKKGQSDPDPHDRGK